MSPVAKIIDGHRWVDITHPETGGSSLVRETAYREAWCHLGWELSDSEPIIVNGAEVPVSADLIVDPVDPDEIQLNLFDHEVDDYDNVGGADEEDSI